MNTKFFQMFGKRSLSLKFSASFKLGVNKKISELSLRQFSIFIIDSFPFNPSYEVAEVSQVQDFNVYGRSSSLKHEICLRISLMKESSKACLGFKLRFSATSKDFKRLSCCLMINLTEIQEHL